MKNVTATIASMITNNLLDESFNAYQVQSILTDAYNEAIANGETPEYDVAEIVEFWNNNY